ncbi:MAG: tetratricopeptide repeat protein [Ktedonobacteraceae bacterium]
MADESSFIGKEMGNYRIVTKLNSGSFGSVYKGEHIYIKHAVAIKVLHTFFGLAQEREQFIREAQLLKMLEHPYILPIFDAGIDKDGFMYIVTEYAPYGSLRDRLKQQPDQPLSLQDALTILSQIGQALHHAHQQNIVHRDLKPENILFNSKGEALLADFGIATVLASARTNRLGQGGTPLYMAPEQWDGIVSMKSDQYALGCIAYELVTGRRPFMTDDVRIAGFQHANVDPTAPTQLNPLLPIHIEQAILKAMAKDRAKRHADVSAFITSLQRSSKQWFNEGNGLYNIQRYEAAVMAYEHAIHLNPSFADAYTNKGISLNDLNRYKEAVAAYEQAIRLNPNHAIAHYNMGIALENLNSYEKAIAAYEQAIRLNPRHASAYHYMGNVLSELKRYEEAIAAYEQAIHLTPNDADIHYNKGVALRNSKRYEESVAAYEQAIRLNPKYASAYHNKGNALSNLKRYEEAVVAYEQAIRLNPKHASAYHSKGNVFKELGRLAEAQKAYEKARQLGYVGH